MFLFISSLKPTCLFDLYLYNFSLNSFCCFGIFVQVIVQLGCHKIIDVRANSGQVATHVCGTEFGFCLGFIFCWSRM